MVPTIGASEAENGHLVPVWSRVFNLGASRRLREAMQAGGSGGVDEGRFLLQPGRRLCECGVAGS